MQRQGRFDQEFPQLGGAFLVAPVTNPYQMRILFPAQWTELLHVSRFVKCPGAVYAKTIHIDFAYGFTKGKHAIHKMKMKLQDFSGARVSTMMAVMKQRNESEFLFERKNLIHHLRIIPLMQQDHMGLF